MTSVKPSKLVLPMSVLAAAALLGFTTLIGAATSPQTPVKPAAPVSPALIAQGQSVYAKLDCSDCHVLNGNGTAVGPDLTHVGATWTQPRLKAVIRHPKKVNPKAIMPGYGAKKITKTQLASLAAYLGSLK
jgi:mono/diheme cytochrome c family protein